MNPGVRKDENGEVTGWLYAGDKEDTSYSETPGDYDPKSHGSCMTGLAISPTYGTAKRATLVIVKTILGEMSDEVDAFKVVYNDIVDKGTSRPVVNYSRNLYINDDGSDRFTNDDKQKLYDALKQLIGKGAVVLVCAGNKGVGDFW